MLNFGLMENYNQKQIIPTHLASNHITEEKLKNIDGVIFKII